MAIYFVPPYSKYYEELNGATHIVSKAGEVVSNSSTLVSTIGKLQSQMDASEWKELGQEQLVTTTIPALKDRFQKFKDNVTNALQVACTESINTLLPLVTTLKEKDELYEKTLNELNNLKEPSKKYETREQNGKEVDTGEFTSEYSAYLQKKEELTKLVADLKKEIEALIVQIDGVVNKIKALNGSVVDFETVSAASGGEVEGLELTEEEEEIVEKTEEMVEEAVASGVYDDLVGGISYNNGETILFNDIGGQEAGYSRKLLTSHGKVVTVFQQFWCEGIPFENGKNTLKNAGCGFNALASILSSKYPDITPEKVFTDMGRKFMYASSIKNYCEGAYGIKVGSREEVSRYDYQAYKAHLVEEVSKGNMVMTTVNARNDNKYTNNSHWVAIVDYDPIKDEFYVTDSADNRDYNAAPIDADRFLKVYSVNTNVVYIADDTNYAKYNM